MTDIKSAFKRCPITIDEVAAAMDLSYENVRKYAAGLRKVPAERAREFRDLTGIPLSVIRPDIWPPRKRGAA